jgi:hypothetical protein
MAKSLTSFLFTGVMVIGIGGAVETPLSTANQPQLAQASTTEAFRQGIADREAWQHWFGATSGNYRTGALYWSGERDSVRPGSCEILSGNVRNGCLAAKHLLDPLDARRMVESDYRLGWGSADEDRVHKGPLESL